MSKTTTASNSLYQAHILPLFELFIWRTPFQIVLAVLIIAQGLVWSLIISPQFALYFTLLLLFIFLFAVSIEFGVLAIILIIPWSWRSIAISAGTVSLPISLKVTYILITIGFSYLLFRLVITKDREWVRTPLDVPLLIFLGLNLLSIAVSVDPLWSLRESLQLTLYIMFYFLVTNVLRTKRSVARAVNMVILATVSIAVVGVFGLTGYSTHTEGFQRMLAGFAGPVLSANYLLMGLPLSFALILGKHKKSKEKLLYILANGILIIALILTYSRAAWIISILMLLLISVLAKSKVKGIAVVVAIILVLSFLGIPRLQERATQILSFDESSNLSHVYLWKASWNLIKQYPILGIGSGAFPRFFEKYEGTSILPPPEIFEKKVYFTARSGYGVPAHNAFLQMWAEVGSFGFIVFLVIIGLFVKTMLSAIRRVRDSHTKLLLIGLIATIVGLLLHNLSITNFIEHFWAVLGIGMAGARVINSEE